MESKSTIGVAIKRLRLRRKMSLRELGSKVGLSAGFLSHIEKGDANPSLETLMKLAEFFECHLGYFFPEDGNAEGYRVMRNQSCRMSHSSDQNVMIEILTNSFDGNPRMEVGFITIGPKANFRGPFAHFGEEMIHIMKGTIQLKLGEREILVKEKETVNFDPRIEHAIINVGQGEAKLLYAISPPRMPLSEI